VRTRPVARDGLLSPDPDRVPLPVEDEPPPDDPPPRVTAVPPPPPPLPPLGPEDRGVAF
jgi:hypothetical protein